AGRHDRLARLGEIAVLAGADEQARPVRAPGDHERIGDDAAFGGVHAAELYACTMDSPASAAADRADDLDAIAGAQARLAVAASRHDRTVHLDSDALAFEREVGHQVGDRLRRAERARGPVDRNGGVAHRSVWYWYDHRLAALKGKVASSRRRPV